MAVSMAIPQRTRLHRLTRNVPLLVKWGLGIALGGFLVAAALVKLIERSPEEQITTLLLREGGTDVLSEYKGLLEGLQNIDLLADGQVDMVPKGVGSLTKWLHGFGDHASGVDEEIKRTTALEHALKAISNSDVSADEKEMLSDYMIGRLSTDPDALRQAIDRIQSLTERVPSPPLVHELRGYLHLADTELNSALASFMREGEKTESVHSREKAWSVALSLGDKTIIGELWSRPEYRNQLSIRDREQAGSMMGDLWLQWTGILHRQWESASMHAVTLAMLAALLWYMLLVRSGQRTTLRWAWPALPVLAGVASIWPTLLLLNYQINEMGMVESTEFPQDLYFNVVGTGLREESAKLLLFLPFLPWLLKRRSAGLAVLTGGFIGLGFSLEENVDYISRGSDAWGRLLTANFLHIALTGMVGHALYQMMRTRFHAAGQFAMMFVMAVVLHGFYNWAPEASARLQYGQDLDLISLILLAFLANQFYELLAQTLEPYNGTISVVSVFIIGSGLLVGIGFISVALTFDSMEAVSAFGSSALGLIPIAIFHVRKIGTW